MKLINTKHCIITLLSTLVVLLSTSTLNAQTVISEENRQTMEEIEFMRQKIKKHQEQKLVLQELQLAIERETNPSSTNNYSNSTSSQYNVEKDVEEYNHHPQQARTQSPTVKSSNSLSRIEAQERQEYRDLEVQYQSDMDRAQREIGRLTKELAIANDQLRKYERGVAAGSDNVSMYNQPQQSVLKKVSKKQKNGTTIDISQPKKEKKQQQPKVKAQKISKQTQSTPQMTDDSRRAMQEEIEELREILRISKEQQEKEKRIIEDLGRQLN